jgi:hypothetical protein
VPCDVRNCLGTGAHTHAHTHTHTHIHSGKHTHTHTHTHTHLQVVHNSNCLVEKTVCIVCGLIEPTAFHDDCPENCRDGHHRVCGTKEKIFLCVKHTELAWAQALFPAGATVGDPTKCMHKVSKPSSVACFDVRACNDCNYVVCAFCDFKLVAGNQKKCHWTMRSAQCPKRTTRTAHIKKIHLGLHIK